MSLLVAELNLIIDNHKKQNAALSEKLAEIENVLAVHQKRSQGMSSGTPDTCMCGAKVSYKPGDEDIIERRDRAFAAHQAKAVLFAISPSVLVGTPNPKNEAQR